MGGIRKDKIGEQWWKWNKEEEVLRDEKGNYKKGRAKGRWERKKEGYEVEGDERGGMGKGREKWKVAFWNVTGLRMKDNQFWTGMRKWDVMGDVRNLYAGERLGMGKRDIGRRV